MARSPARNKSQAIDYALDAYIQLEDVLEERVDEVEEELDELDGEGIGVRCRVGLE